MSKSATDYLQHILQECDFLLSLTETGLTKDALLNDEVLKRAVVRSLEIIGEATKKIPADVKVQWSSISWKTLPVCAINSFTTTLALITPLFGMW